MNTRFIVASLLFVSVLALSAVACNAPIQISFGESEPAASQWNEDPDWNGPQGEEPHFEEPFGEEPHGEPQFEEPHGEEPFHEEPHFEEPHHEPEPHPQEPPPQPQPQQPQGQPSGNNGGSNNGQGANWTTDVAVTDIYPGNQPHGQIHARITNHGPGTMDKVQVRVVCSSERTDKNNGSLSSGGMADLNLTVSLKPGETYSVPTGLTLDTNTFEYLVGCQMHDTYPDPDLGNNTYSEQFK